MEEARDEVSRILLTLEERELISLCEHLKCNAPVGGFASKTRRTLNRLVETTLDEIEEDEESAESYQQYLQHVLSYLASLKPTPGETEAEIVIQETSELEKLKMQYQKLQQQMEEEIGALEEKIKRKTQAAGDDTSSRRRHNQQEETQAAGGDTAAEETQAQEETQAAGGDTSSRRRHCACQRDRKGRGHKDCHHSTNQTSRGDAEAGVPDNWTDW
ncbi:hypothetical protein CesoFtcFv8_012085 [Champsocephalus esox]|uniref:Uncharacterized protein n=1 Tax=Champsocephalus esox TaxID=159716 RepID=A0AAN8BUA7_9TELE|nr:hypothetical protein CesoFtcFv8_012085 [Champsocephalus esox]